MHPHNERFVNGKSLAFSGVPNIMNVMKQALAFPLIRLAIVAGVTSLAFVVADVRAQILYSESFDSEESSKVTERIDEFCFVDYIDYSSFKVGDSEDLMIEEAPNMVEGSAATRGVMLRCNVESDENFDPTVGGAINLLLADERAGSQVQFSGNYRLTFDVWMNMDEFTTRESSGTTEVTIWGVGSESAITQGRITRNDGAVTGTWGWLACDGGFGTEDSMFRIGTTEVEKKNDGPPGAGNDPLFLEAFPDAEPISAAPSNSWVTMEVVVRNGTVAVSYNGVLFHRGESDQTDGGAFIGYEDPFSSLSWSPDYQFSIIDNVVVEQIGSGTIIVKSDTPVGTVLDAEGNLAVFSITNENTEDLVISEANLTGENAAAFTVITELPITVAPGGEAKLEVQFTPDAPNGEKMAQLTLESNDPIEPSLVVELIGRRAIAEPLMAHFKLDEAQGSTTAVDSSGVGTLGTYNANPDDPIGFEQPSLIGGDGTSVAFTAASSPGVGNFAQLQPLHTPTVSVSLWIKPEEIIGEHTLFNRDPLFDGSDTIYGAIVTADGGIIFKSGGSVVLETDPDLIEEGKIYHIVVTHLDEDGFGNDTASRSRLYIDGELILEASDDETFGFDEYPSNTRVFTMFLASKTAAGFGYTGAIDDVQVYSIELTPEQVAGMFGVPGATAFETSPPGLFSITDLQLDDATGSVTLTWNSVPGKVYLVEASSNLTDWGEAADGVVSGGEFTTFIDMDVPEGASERYYRVTEE